MINFARPLGFLVAALTLTISALGVPSFAATSDIRGLWVDHREREKQAVAVWIDECDGLMCGHIYWLKKPLSADGQPKRDRHNPNTALRDRPRCGLKILTGFRRLTENTWGEGQIYNPSDGQTYSSSLTLGSDGSLGIRGFVGISMFGKTIEWVRPSEVPERCK